MCGIYGWNYPKGKVGIERRAMVAAILAIANDTRGGDSWGFYDRNNLIKGLGDISQVAVKTVKSDLIMAHTRKATTGSITTENAHPFDIGNIIGAHNGIIQNHTELNAKYKREFQVDSMHLFGHINDGLPFSDIYGYGAIEFIRKDEKDVVYLCKLQAGDLSIVGLGENPDNYHGVVWSSNGNHLTQALETAGIKHFDFKVDTGKVYRIQNGKLFFALKDGKEVTMALGTRTEYGNHYGYNYRSSVRPTPPAAKKLTTDEYAELLEGMTDDEEKEFFKMWAKEEGLDEVVAELIEEVESEEIEAGNGEDWGNETKALLPASTAPTPTSTEIEKKLTDMASSAQFDHKTDSWVKVEDGTMTPPADNKGTQAP
jgi:hypothetical protein